MTYIILHDMVGELTTIPEIDFTESSEEGLGDAVYNAVEALMNSMENYDDSVESILNTSEDLVIFKSVEKVGDLDIKEFIRKNAVLDFENYEYQLYLKLKEKYEK